MADFCMQCAVKILGVKPEQNDLKGLSTPEDTQKGLYALALCEGCGPIQVNHNGFCVSKDCLEKGHK